MESSSDGDYWQCLLLISNKFILNPLSFNLLFAIAVILIFLGISALISGSEVAFFSLSKKDLKDLSKKHAYQDQAVVKLLNNPRYLLSTILIFNNLVNIAIIITSSYVILSMFDFSNSPIWGFIVEVLVISFLILLLSEIAPKIYATKNNIKLARLMAIPLYIAGKISHPLNYLLVGLTDTIERRIKRKNYEVSIEELNHAIEITTEQDTTKAEKKILKELVRFGNIAVKQIMHNRVDVVAISNNAKFDELLKQVKKSGYSRLPVYEENFDNIKGILYSKDLIEHTKKGKNFRWQRLIRPPFFVPEIKKIGDLLKEFQQRKMHLAIVVDEYGGSSGIVTLEDILEEIVGDIVDEFDKEEINYKKIDANNYIFEGKILLSDFIRFFNLSNDFFNDIKGDADSLAGLILELGGEIPSKKAKLTYKQFVFIVESVGKKRINKIKIIVLSAKEKQKND